MAELLTIPERARALVADHLGVELYRVVPDAEFVHDLGADSLDSVELAMAVEDEFKPCEMSDDDTDKVFNHGKFSDLTAWLEQQRTIS